MGTMLRRLGNRKEMRRNGSDCEGVYDGVIVTLVEGLQWYVCGRKAIGGLV